VKIVRVVRREGSESVDNYFYCSNRSWITPYFVEWCRYYRWKLENGFNAWTNKWNLLKHVFNHTYAACDAMIGLIFLSIIFVENYRRGNLNRGNQKYSLTLKLFFNEVIKSISYRTRNDFLIFWRDFSQGSCNPTVT